jgi:uncharacterized protein
MKDRRRHNRGAAISAALLAAMAPAFGAAIAQGTATAAETKAQEERLELVTASGTHAFDVELATTPEQQALGLMFRTHLADTKGMLFFHGPKPRELTMWMRNTYIPLDMVFIRADGTVHHIAARTEPFSERMISSQGQVAGVLEIGGGIAERLGLKPGDKVRHRLFGAAPSK